MCYDIKVLYETALKRAKRKNDPDRMKQIEEELKSFKSAEYHHASGYSHPKIPIYTSKQPNIPTLYNWGLIPFWTKNEQSALKIQNSTLNARVESILEKPTFRKAAKNQHCLIYVDGFYEHHHSKGKTFPHYIKSKNEKPLCLAGLWDEWINPETGEIHSGFSIVTTQGKGLLKTIHNNPKLEEARMPILLGLEDEDKWINMDFDKQNLLSFIGKESSIEIKAYSVKPLRGKSSLGNIPEASAPFNYPELSSSLKLDFLSTF